jgi:hypothetical protein
MRPVSNWKKAFEPTHPLNLAAMNHTHFTVTNGEDRLAFADWQAFADFMKTLGPNGHAVAKEYQNMRATHREATHQINGQVYRVKAIKVYTSRQTF